MLEQYEQLVHAHEQVLIAEARLTNQVRVLEAENDRLRAEVGAARGGPREDALRLRWIGR